MKNAPTAAVLLIGDELLSGSIQDENLAHISKTLASKGIRVRETRIVPDLEHEIVAAVNALRSKYNYVLTTGGIGPTHDDITSDAIAKAFGVNNVVQQKIFDVIDAYRREKGLEFSPAAQRMAHAPEGSEVIETQTSMVPGYRKENVYVMAGVPRIMRLMLDAIVERLEVADPVVSKSIHANVGEATIAPILEEIQNRYPQVDIGSYPQDADSTISDYKVIFVVRGTDVQLIDRVRTEILGACEANGIEAIIG